MAEIGGEVSAEGADRAVWAVMGAEVGDDEAAGASGTSDASGAMLGVAFASSAGSGEKSGAAPDEAARAGVSSKGASTVVAGRTGVRTGTGGQAEAAASVASASGAMTSVAAGAVGVACADGVASPGFPEASATRAANRTPSAAASSDTPTPAAVEAVGAMNDMTLWADMGRRAAFSGAAPAAPGLFDRASASLGPSIEVFVI